MIDEIFKRKMMPNFTSLMVTAAVVATRFERGF